MNKPVYFGIFLLEISKIVMYELHVYLIMKKVKYKSKIMLHGYRQLYSLHKSKRHLLKHCKRC